MTAATGARTWLQHGHPNTRQPGQWLNIQPHPRAAAMYGPGAVPLAVTEDPDGNYLGWIENGDTELVMVQWHTIFDMQFPYGAKAAADAGQGEIVRLTVTEADPDTAYTLPEHWNMHAHHTNPGGYRHVQTKASRTALYSTTSPVVPVTVTVDPNGRYTGWILTGTTTPIHIARTRLFDMAFTYGHAADQEAGKGRAITLTITPGHNTAPDKDPHS